jgi:hypothetical protein
LVGQLNCDVSVLTADSGSNPILGPFESRVIGVGPQVGCSMSPFGPELTSRDVRYESAMETEA